ncbi:hypothetical protein [Nocardioides sp. NPDC006273]|uniref:hypothetical protein n=1 Tax=Nocardioides sp. NPDC006273 TaxID=3155598 RepID=UPI0033A918E9
MDAEGRSFRDGFAGFDSLGSPAGRAPGEASSRSFFPAGLAGADAIAAGSDSFIAG